MTQQKFRMFPTHHLIVPKWQALLAAQNSKPQYFYTKSGIPLHDAKMT